MVGLLADDEEGDFVVGLDLGELIDVGRDELEDEHDVVAPVQVELLVLLQRVVDFLLLLVLLQQPRHVVRLYRLGLLDHGLVRTLLLLDLPLDVHEVLVDLHALLVEVLVLAHPQTRPQPVEHLLLGFDQGVVVNLTPGDPVLGIDRQTAVDEVAGVLGDGDLGKVRTGVPDFLEDVRVTHAHEWITAVEQLIVDDAHRPDIGLHPVGPFLQQLWSHCQTGAENGVGHLLLHLFGETQVRDLADSLMQQHIGQLEVAVHSLDLVQRPKSIEDLFQKIVGFVLSEALLFIKVLLEIAAVAVFHRNQDAVLRHPVVNVPDHVLVFGLQFRTLLQHLDFRLDQLFQFGRALEEHLGDGFDGNDAAVAFIDRLVDHGPRTLAQDFEKAESFQLLALQLLVADHLLF